MDCTHLDLLSPDEMRFFWLRWYGDYISFGSGSVFDANVITGFGEPLPDLKAIALYGYEQTVKYEVRNIAGKNISLFFHYKPIYCCIRIDMMAQASVNNCFFNLAKLQWSVDVFSCA